MLFNQQNGSDLEVVGGKVYDTTIDAKDIEIITTLLSSNLYSEPEKSFIREIVSNAWDSEVEAGTTDMPVLVKFTKNDNLNYTSVIIRDYGTGISKERMENVFVKIGSSTKRASNNFIGCFGIGRFSALAVSNMVTIISYYNGTAYTYVMTKDNNKIQAILLDEQSTEERNGVEYRVKIDKPCEDTTTKYKQALRSIVFFPNIYVDNAGHLGYPIDNFNDIKIKEFKYFKFATRDIKDKILLGNVLYPLNEQAIEDKDKTYENIMTKMYTTGFVFKFDIGELEVTPNRESIIYNEHTIATIRKRILEAVGEMERYAERACTKDTQDFEEYAEHMNAYLYWNPIQDKIMPNKEILQMEGKGYLYCDNSGRKKIPMTYKGKNYSLCNIWDSIKNKTIPEVLGISYKGKFLKEGIHNIYGVSNLVKAFSKNTRFIVAVSEGTRFTKMIKAYLSYTYSDCPVVRQMTKEEFTRVFLHDNYLIVLDNEENRYLISEFYDWLQKKVVHEDFKNKNYREFVERQTIKCNGHKIFDTKIKYTIYTDIDRKYSGYYTTYEELENDIRNKKELMIIGSIKDDAVLWGSIAATENIEFLVVNKKIREALLKNISWVISTDKWIKRHLWEIKICNTLYECVMKKWDYQMNYYDAFRRTFKVMYNFADLNEGSIFDTMNKWLPNSHRSSCYVKLAEELNIGVDKKLGEMFKKIELKVQEMRDACAELSDNHPDYILRSESGVCIVLLMLKKAKIFRLSKKAMEYINNNKVVKLLGLK